MKNTIKSNNIGTLTALTVSTLGSIAILSATPQLSPENISESAELIQMEFYHDPLLEGSELTISITDQIATIGGEAQSLAQAERAAARAYASPDVAAVIDRVKIKSQPSVDLLATAKSHLTETNLVASDKINVKIEGSKAILTGTAGSMDDAELARELVSETPGIADVDNLITVNFAETRTDGHITEQLKFTVSDDPVFIGLDLAPSVENGIVKWNGQVGSEDEFNRLVRKSFVTGVTDVDTAQLTVNSDLMMEQIEDKEYTPSQKLEAFDAALATTGQSDVEVDLEAGTLVLTGEVETDSQREIAERTARAIPGVLAVTNEIKIDDDNVALNEYEVTSASAPALRKK